ncbi:MAG: hypothetical protein ABIH87_04815 [bacterium]
MGRVLATHFKDSFPKEYETVLQEAEKLIADKNSEEIKALVEGGVVHESVLMRLIEEERLPG